MYNSIEKQPFRFDHCWDLLKNEQKWLDREAIIVSCKRKSTMSRSLPALVSEDATDELMASSNGNNNERPIGQKTAKERKKSGKSLLGDASLLSSALSELKDEKKKAHNEKMMANALSIQSTTDARAELLQIRKAQLLEAKEGNRIKSEKLKFLQSKEDMEIMMKHTSSMTPEKRNILKYVAWKLIE
ncbi:hypothetical protein LIER_09229 [Lithospermum erythrorhizon]|uniref:No apical meristem-associated C-terminal domain-containing protein n=1 Tax=Lithospermum erythrorhizon TaxID=34254 RepID=A0AAV3PHT4_LITER